MSVFSTLGKGIINVGNALFTLGKSEEPDSLKGYASIDAIPDSIGGFPSEDTELIYGVEDGMRKQKQCGVAQQKLRQSNNGFGKKEPSRSSRSIERQQERD